MSKKSTPVKSSVLDNNNKKKTLKKSTPKKDKEETIDIVMEQNTTNDMASDIEINLDKFNPNDIVREKIESLGFTTDNSKDISIKLIRYAQTCINRSETVCTFSPLVGSHKMAIEIEKGIFEFALVHITLNSLDKNNISAIYKDKVHDIYANLDNKSHIKNKTLLPALLSGVIKPCLIAFLAPHQLHPERWADVINKKKYEEDVESNIATSDLYRCSKCGERKCRITELQMRGLDEPVSRFVTCMVCHNTFIL